MCLHGTVDDLMWCERCVAQAIAEAEADLRKVAPFAVVARMKVVRAAAKDDLRKPLPCGHAAANLVPIEGALGLLYRNPEPNEQCSVCAEVERARRETKKKCIEVVETYIDGDALCSPSLIAKAIAAAIPARKP